MSQGGCCWGWNKYEVETKKGIEEGTGARGRIGVEESDDGVMS